MGDQTQYLAGCRLWLLGLKEFIVSLNVELLTDSAVCYKNTSSKYGGMKFQKHSKTAMAVSVDYTINMKRCIGMTEI